MERFFQPKRRKKPYESDDKALLLVVGFVGLAILLFPLKLSLLFKLLLSFMGGMASSTKRRQADFVWSRGRSPSCLGHGR